MRHGSYHQYALKISQVLLGLGLCVTSWSQDFQSSLHKQASFNWVFSGVMMNEQHDHYGYYFEFIKNQNHHRVLSALIQLDQKKLIFVEEDQADFDDHDDQRTQWEVGRSYLALEPVTQRLLLGIKNDHQQGFRFKIDTFEPMHYSRPQALKLGLAFNVTQLGRITGHVFLNDQVPDEFVHAKRTWFRQLSDKNSEEQHSSRDLTGVFCHFDDGSGFYAMHLPKEDALSGFVAGWHDAAGKSLPMSQFVKISQSLPHEWDLTIPTPQMHVHFSDLLSKGNVAAGVVHGKKFGFCTAENG